MVWQGEGQPLDAPDGMAWVVLAGRKVLLSQRGPRPVPDRFVVDTLPDPHLSGTVEGDPGHEEKKKRSIEPWPTAEQWKRVNESRDEALTCPRCESKDVTIAIYPRPHEVGELAGNVKCESCKKWFFERRLAEQWESVSWPNIVQDASEVANGEWDHVRLPTVRPDELIGDCEQCRGTGKWNFDVNSTGFTCKRCGGSGRSRNGDQIKMKICTKCAGDGLERSELTDEPVGTCPECRGDGVMRAPNPDATICRNCGANSPIVTSTGLQCRHCFIRYTADRSEYLDENNEKMRCDDMDCDGWLYLIDGGDMLECGKCGSLHDLHGIATDGEDEDEEEDRPPTAEEWAEDFSAMDDRTKAESIRILAKHLGIPSEMAEMLIAQNSGSGDKIEI